MGWQTQLGCPPLFFKNKGDKTYEKAQSSGATYCPLLFAGAASAAETINGAGRNISQRRFTRNGLTNTRWRTRTFRSIISRSVRARGIKQLTEGTVDFGASDMPMTDEQIKALKIKAAAFSDRSRRRMF